MTMTDVRPDGGADVVTRDLVSAETAEALSALPIERRLLAIAATLGGEDGLVYGLRALAGVHERAAKARPNGSEERTRLTLTAAECRLLVLQVQLVEAAARQTGEADVRAAALRMADELAGVDARQTEQRCRAIAAHLAEASAEVA